MPPPRTPSPPRFLSMTQLSCSCWFLRAQGRPPRRSGHRQNVSMSLQAAPRWTAFRDRDRVARARPRRAHAYNRDRMGTALLGGALIGLAAAGLLVLTGKTAGVSGIVDGVLRGEQ